MVHSYKSSSETQQAGSQLFRIRHPHPRPRIYSPYTRTLPCPPSYPSHSIFPPRKDCFEFLEEIFKLESVSEQVYRIDDRIKELQREKMKRAVAKATITETRSKITELLMKVIDEERDITEGLRNAEALKRLLMQTQLQTKL